MRDKDKQVLSTFLDFGLRAIVTACHHTFQLCICSSKSHKYRPYELQYILELETLKLRRLPFDLVQYYKIFNNLTSLCPDDFFQ